MRRTGIHALAVTASLFLWCAAVPAATITFQRGVSPTTSYTISENELPATATRTGASNPQVCYFNYPQGKRLIVQFDVSQIPAGSTVTAATLSYCFYNGASIQAPIGLYRVTTNWLGGVAWTNPGGDWKDKNGTSQGAVPFATSPATTNSWFSWDVTPLVQGWVAGTSPNYGVILKVDSAATGWGQAYGSGHAVTSIRPYLSVTYTTSSALDTTPPTIASLAASPGARPYVADVTTLTASATDNVSPTLQYQFLLDGAVVRDWSAAASYAWTAPATAAGLRRFAVNVRDASQNVATRSIAVFVLRTPVSAPP